MRRWYKGILLLFQVWWQIGYTNVAHHLGCSSFGRDPSKIVEIQDKIKDSLTQTKENKIENLGVYEGNKVEMWHW